MEKSPRPSGDFAWPPRAEEYEASDFQPDQQTAVGPGQTQLASYPRVPPVLAPRPTSARDDQRWLAGAVALLSVVVIAESTYLFTYRGRQQNQNPEARSATASAGNAENPGMTGLLRKRGDPTTDVSTSEESTPTATSGTGDRVAAVPRPAGDSLQRANGVNRTAARGAQNQNNATVVKLTEPGWASIALPFRADVFEQGRFIATSDATRIAFAPGEHTLDLVNDSLNYRSRRTVQISTGKATALAPTLPLATLNVNANPWAEVFIDGKSMGETPLGNLQLAIGVHQVRLRHPILVEETRTVTIAAGKVTRLSVNLQK